MNIKWRNVLGTAALVTALAVVWMHWHDVTRAFSEVALIRLPLGPDEELRGLVVLALAVLVAVILIRAWNISRGGRP